MRPPLPYGCLQEGAGGMIVLVRLATIRYDRRWQGPPWGTRRVGRRYGL